MQIRLPCWLVGHKFYLFDCDYPDDPAPVAVGEFYRAYGLCRRCDNWIMFPKGDRR